MIKTSLNLVKSINFQIQEVQWTSNRINREKTIHRHIIVKLLKAKENHESIQRKRAHYRQGNIIFKLDTSPICPSTCLISDFLVPDLQSFTFKAPNQGRPLSTVHELMLTLTLSLSSLHPKWMTRCSTQSPSLEGFSLPLSLKVTPLVGL